MKEALELFDCKEDLINEFDVEDTFNPGNSLQGYMCRVGDHRYGALYITSVNHVSCNPQVIWGTPKIKYPFNKNGTFMWPAVKKMNEYRKIDGTNIVAYKYEADGKEFVTYKTRMTPIVQDGKFGGFATMWKEMLEKYPVIPDVVLQLGINLSFELYGNRNFHLIVYDTPLDIALLFGVTRTVEPKIVDIEEIYVDDIAYDFPYAGYHECEDLSDLTAFYTKILEEQEEENIDSDGLGIVGEEGYIFYAHLEDGTVKPFKAKPATVQKIHWSSGGPSTGIIRATALNALENRDSITVRFVAELLCEEFAKEVVDKHMDKIKRVVHATQDEIELRLSVLDVYRDMGLDVVKDKAGTMRALSGLYKKRQMRHVYWIVTNLAR